MSFKNASSPYTSDFYSAQADGSAASAAVVVPLFLALLPVKSIVDVGCGVGTWANEFLVNGVPEVLGIDGGYVNPSQLRIPARLFVAQNLLEPIRLNRNFDVAVCLEVAEHLPESRARGLVADLTSLARCVLFSAAVPGQGGTQHLNEQHLSYWVALFQKHRYEAIDAIRPLVLGNSSVEWWYQQNTVVFASHDHPLLLAGLPKPRNIIHQQLYDSVRRELLYPTPRRLLSAFPGAVTRSIRHRLGLSSGRLTGEPR
jgi:SAM-dependent methyltransferase